MLLGRLLITIIYDFDSLDSSFQHALIKRAEGEIHIVLSL